MKPVCKWVTLPSPFNLSEVFRTPFAVWQPRANEIGEFTHRPEWAAALHKALHEAQASPRPLSVPRRIFISYRWGDPTANAWVNTLRQQLELRGNYVEFDQTAQRETDPPSVPELVGRIAGCHIFLAVLDPGYLERVVAVDSKDVGKGWVTDEFHTALAFAENGSLNIMGFLRDGNHLHPAFRPFVPGIAGNTFDVRDPRALVPILDQFFVQFGAMPDEKIAVRAAAALHASQQAFVAGNTRGAIDHAEEACRLVPGLADGFAQRARMAYRARLPAQAFQDARHAVKIDPTMTEMLVYAAAAATDLEQWREAAHFARVVLERDRAQANAHYLIGKALTRLSQEDAALAHFEIARGLKLMLPSLYNDAGALCRRLGNPVKALEWFGEGLNLAPLDSVLLVNSTAAAMEAGRADLAIETLDLLAKHHPKAPQLNLLTSTLTHWCQADLAPPALSPRILRPPSVGIITCSDCPANVAVLEDTQMLCAGCGALLTSQKCDCCGSTGMVAPAFEGAPFQCPYCGQGFLHYKTVKKTVR